MGYTKIDNDILEALYSSSLNGTEINIILMVIRKTYGFNKKEDWISYSTFVKTLGITRPNVWKSIESLVTKKQLVRRKESGRTFYSLNEAYNDWLVTKTKLVTKTQQSSYENVTSLVTKTKPTKESITKDNIQKKVHDFEIFWNSYPKKVGRKDAYKVFIKISDSVERLMIAIETQKKSELWLKDEGKYIPNPATWLNGERWRDEVFVSKNKVDPYANYKII